MDIVRRSCSHTQNGSICRHSLVRRCSALLAMYGRSLDSYRASHSGESCKPHPRGCAECAASAQQSLKAEQKDCLFCPATVPVRSPPRKSKSTSRSVYHNYSITNRLAQTSREMETAPVLGLLASICTYGELVSFMSATSLC